MGRFLDRRDAGKQLARKLIVYADRLDVIVLALPRGGVPVAYEVCQAIRARLDVLVVRKLGLPGQEELAIGAIASGGIRILNEDIINALWVREEIIDRVSKGELAELQRREHQYRGDRPALEVKGHTVILIDDGLATGASMLAAVRAVRTQQPGQVLVAVPTTAIQAMNLLRPEVDKTYYVIAPEPFEGVGKWYKDFSQTTDQEVQHLLEEADRQFHNK